MLELSNDDIMKVFGTSGSGNQLKFIVETERGIEFVKLDSKNT